MTNIAYSTHITNSHEHIYIQHMLPIVASFIHTYTQFHQYYTVSSIGSKFHKVKTKTKDKHSISEITRNDLKLNIYFPKNYLITKIFSGSSSFLPTCITKTLRKREWVRSRNVAFHLVKCNVQFLCKFNTRKAGEHAESFLA